MDDYLSAKGLCHVCREEMTTINAEASPGCHIYVCERCLESAKENFIWICVSCGNVYIRPKSLVLKRLKDPELRRAYLQCEGMQLIQGIDRCIECAPEEIVAFVASAKSDKSGGHC